MNFERARVRPNFSLDVSAGVRLWEADAQSVSIQFDVRNLTGRLNVINFNGLFSGTALAPGEAEGVFDRVRFPRSDHGLLLGGGVEDAFLIGRDARLEGRHSWRPLSSVG